MDVHTPEQRSHNMRRIGARNTRPELLVRSGLHRRGLRFRLHNSRLPGKPDIVFPGRRAVIFVHGCFWHGHDCPIFRLPQTRTDFWRRKIEANKERDARTLNELSASGWRSLVLWECALRGTRRLTMKKVIDLCQVFLQSPDKRCADIRGGRVAKPARQS